MHNLPSPSFKALDADVGNYSKCYYELIGSEGLPFYMNPLTGDLHCRMPVSTVTQPQYELQVKATDDLGRGQEVTVNLKVRDIF